MKIEIINKTMLCWDSDELNARELHVLAKITDCSTKYPYKVINADGSVSSLRNAKPLQLTKPRVIEDGLVYGDIIVKDTYKNKVLGVCNEVIFLSTNNDYTKIATIPYVLSELIEYGYTLYNEQPQEIVELTIHDISEGKGTGIDPKLIRIKE